MNGNTASMPHQNASPLLDSLPEEASVWRSLLSSLSSEEQALTDGHPEVLGRLGTEKVAHIQSLARFAKLRNDALLAAGLSPDAAGMASWLESHGSSSDRSLWADLLHMEEEARAINSRVGTLIELRLSTTRQALNILVQAATSHGCLYDQDGLSVSGRNGKPLASA